jgi:hypothetical protein
MPRQKDRGYRRSDESGNGGFADDVLLLRRTDGVIA